MLEFLRARSLRSALDSGNAWRATNGGLPTRWRQPFGGSLIETQYARGDYRQVYDSLLDIHRAQENSIHQLGCKARAGEMDLLSLTFAKGGTSVLGRRLPCCRIAHLG